MDRVEFYPDDRDDRAHFETIIWKRSIVIENIFGLDGAEVSKVLQNVRTAYGRYQYLKLEKVRDVKFST